MPAGRRSVSRIRAQMVEERTAPQEPEGKEERKIKTLLEDISLLERYVHELSVFFPLPLCFVSPLGVILEVNPAFEEMFGFKFHELIGEPLEKILAKEKTEALVQETLREHPVHGQEMEFRAQNGSLIPVGVFTKARKDEQGQILGLFISLLDLRELKKTNEELKETAQALQVERDQLAQLQRAVEVLLISKERPFEEMFDDLAAILSAALGASALAIWRPTDDGIGLSPAFNWKLSDRYMRYFREHPLPMRGGTIVGQSAHSRDAMFTSDLFRDIRATPEAWASGTLQAIQKEGVVSLASFPLLVNGELFGVLNIYFDRTHEFPESERRVLRVAAHTASIAIGNAQYQEELKNTQLALMNMLEDTDEALRRVEAERNRTQLIIAHLTDGLVVLENDARISLVNPRAEDMFRLPAKALLGKRFSELGTEERLRGLAKALAAEGELFRAEVSLGEDVVAEVTDAEFGEKEGSRQRMIILHDITREKQVERLKTEFVSLAAHQLRTPLAAIKWTLRMLLDGDLGDLNKEQEEFIGKTYRSNERMIGLINDLLDVTRIEEGRYLSRPEPGKIDDILSGLVNTYEEDAERKGVTLSLELPPEGLPLLMIDEEKIRLVFQNLLENALHYTPKGGSIEVAVQRAEHEIKVSVRDSGIGIPPGQQGRIFQKFFRADNAKRVDTEGSGLGLYVSKNIVEAHEGRIWFESKPKGGTVFFVVLPVKG